MSTYWTAQSTADYRYSVISSFLMQLERKMLDEDISRKELAARLNVTAGRVSQILNGQLDNFSVEKVVEYAQALEMDVSLVAYENANRDIPRGPINPEIFAACWERMGRPQDFFDLEESQDSQSVSSAIERFFAHSETPATQVELVEVKDNVRDLFTKRPATQTDVTYEDLLAIPIAA